MALGSIGEKEAKVGKNESGSSSRSSRLKLSKGSATTSPSAIVVVVVVDDVAAAVVVLAVGTVVVRLGLSPESNRFAGIVTTMYGK